MRRSLSLISLTLSACGHARQATPGSAGDETSQASPVAVAPAPADACGWIPEATVAGILGPRTALRRAVRSIERAKPASAGTACRKDVGDAKAVVLQVDLSGAIIEERVGGAMLEQFREAMGAMAGARADTMAAEQAAAS